MVPSHKKLRVFGYGCEADETNINSTKGGCIVPHLCLLVFMTLWGSLLRTVGGTCDFSSGIMDSGEITKWKELREGKWTKT